MIRQCLLPTSRPLLKPDRCCKRVLNHNHRFDFSQRYRDGRRRTYCLHAATSLRIKQVKGNCLHVRQRKLEKLFALFDHNRNERALFSTKKKKIKIAMKSMASNGSHKENEKMLRKKVKRHRQKWFFLDQQFFSKNIKSNDLKWFSNGISLLMKKKEELCCTDEIGLEYGEKHNLKLLSDVKGLVGNLHKCILNREIQTTGNNIHVISGIFADALHILSVLPADMSSVDDAQSEEESNISLHDGDFEESTSTNDFKASTSISDFGDITTDLGECASYDDFEGTTSIFVVCEEILYILNSLDFDVTPNHLFSAITAGCKEGKYSEAAFLFKSQYNADDSTNPPMDPTLGRNNPLELGMYAIAKAAQEDNPEGVLEEVYGAAMSMSLTSPGDYKSYALAGICALGRAREWEACIKCLVELESVSGMDEAIVAAVMNACIECEKGSVALNIYQERFEQNEELNSLAEWQTGGKYDTISSSCRNAALSAFHCLDNYDDSTAIMNHALKILSDLLETKSELSSPAVMSLLLLCERFDDRERSTWLIEQIIDNTLLGGEEIVWPRISFDMIASVMRVCNQTGQYGASIYFWYLSNLALHGKPIDVTSVNECTDDSHVLSSIPSVKQNRKVRTLLADAIRCCKDHELADKLVGEETSKGTKSNEPITAGDELSKYQSSETFWRGLFRKIGVFQNMLMFNNNPELEKDKIVNRLVNLIRFCSERKQPMIGILLSQRIARFLKTNATGILPILPSSREDKVSLIEEHEFLFSTDFLLSALMEAYIGIGWEEEAVNFYFEKAKKMMYSASSCDTLDYSAYQCIVALLKMNDVERAYHLFISIDNVILTHEVYLMMSRLLVREGKWKEMSFVWDLAGKNHCLSEELALLMLQSICNSGKDERLKDKVKVLGDVVWIMAKHVGKSKNEWKKSQYWALKEKLSEKDMKTLMWSVREDEFSIAVEAYEDARNKGDTSQLHKEACRTLLRGICQENRRSWGTRRDGFSLAVEQGAQENISSRAADRENISKRIKDVLNIARNSIWGDDPDFTSEVSHALLNLGEYVAMINFVEELVERGCEVQPKTFLNAIIAAKLMSNDDAIGKIEDMMKIAGIRYQINNGKYVMF